MFDNKQQRPLAWRQRPADLASFVGQQHLLGPGAGLQLAISQQAAQSCLLWGPPGSGKTTLAHILAKCWGLNLCCLSALDAGVKQIRELLAAAEHSSILCFIDEIHRFNTSQQDSLLAGVEDGRLIVIAATTENPSFALNAALLSRLQVYQLYALGADDLAKILAAALQDADTLKLTADAQQYMIEHADGDARQLLNALELCINANLDSALTIAQVQQLLGQSQRRYDKRGDCFYQQISALHKSIRGSDPDAALYWLARMLDAGCDVKYICRRLIRMAAEDIANADPRALEVALNAQSAYECLGPPEGDLVLAQAVVYLAVAAKSNAVYLAYSAAQADVKRYGSAPVPLHLQPAANKFMRDRGCGRDYSYSHDCPNAFSAVQQYFPDNMTQQDYYQPVERGLEIKIKAKLLQLRQQREQAVDVK